MRTPVMLGVLAALVFVSGPARTATGEVRGGAIRIGMDADMTTMDPHRSTAAVDRQVYNNLYGKLVDIDAKFGIVPQLAQSWEIRNGGLTYVFKLPKRVKLHDGRDLTAEIVKGNFDRKREPALATPRRSEIAPVKEGRVVDAARAERGLKVSEIASLWWQAIHLNNQVPPFNVKAVRQAIWYAVDRAVIQRVVYYGQGAPAWGPFPPSMWAQDREFTDWKRDVARAKAKLAEGGMPNGFSFVVKGWNQPTHVQELQIVQAQLKEIGVDMKIELLEFGKLLADLNSHTFVALRIGWSGRPDPDGNAHVFLHSKGGLNRVRYSNPKMDELLDQARAESDIGKRKALYVQVTRLAAEDAPYAWLHHDAEIKVWADHVKGFEHISDGMLRMKGVWIETR